jgi:hypothetical protein
VIFKNNDGTSTTILGPDAKDFIANGLPFMSDNKRVDMFIM